ISASPSLATRPTTRGSSPASCSAFSTGRNRGLPRLRSFAIGSSDSCSTSGCDRSSSSRIGVDERRAIQPNLGRAATLRIANEPADGLVEDVVALAEGEPQERLAHLAVVAERGRGNRCDTRLVRQGPGERLAVVDAERPYVGLHEVRRL